MDMLPGRANISNIGLGTPALKFRFWPNNSMMNGNTIIYFKISSHGKHDLGTYWVSSPSWKAFVLGAGQIQYWMCGTYVCGPVLGLITAWRTHQRVSPSQLNHTDLILLPRPWSLQVTPLCKPLNLAHPRKQLGRISSHCSQLGRVATTQRPLGNVTTANIPRQHRGYWTLL